MLEREHALLALVDRLSFLFLNMDEYPRIIEENKEDERKDPE